jgi:hypothetical protein
MTACKWKICREAVVPYFFANADEQQDFRIYFLSLAVHAQCLRAVESAFLIRTNCRCVALSSRFYI